MVSLLGETELVEEFVVALAGGVGTLAAQRREEFEILADGEPPVDVPRALQHCSDVAVDGALVVAGVDAGDLDVARGRHDEAENRLDGRRLPRPVRAEHADDLAAVHFEGDVDDGSDGILAFAVRLA